MRYRLTDSQGYWRSVVVLLGAGLLGGCANDVAERHAFDAWLEVDEVTFQTGGVEAMEMGVVGLSEKGESDEAADAEAFDSGATVEEYFAYAALHNPGLEAAFYRWAAALEKAPQARALPDAMLSYRYFIENVETRVGPQRNKIGLTQTLPWFGKRQLRSEMALEGARVEAMRYEAKKLELLYRIEQAYCERYYLGQAIKVVSENVELVQYLEQVAVARLRVATGQHPDAIRAQVELGRLENQLQSMRDRLRPSAAVLNAAMHRAIDAPLAVPEALPESSEVMEAVELADRIDRVNPKLMEWRYEAARSRKGIGLARLDEYPDVTVGVDYIETGDALGNGPSDSGQDAVAVGFAVNLPLDDTKRVAAVNENLARFHAANRQRVDLRNMLLAEVDDALYAQRDAQRKADLYRDTLLPKANQSLRATEASFRTGGSSFTDLIDAQRVLLEFGLNLQRALTDRAIQQARLESLVPSISVMEGK